MTSRNPAQHLIVGADWACAHGDAGGLADVARRLAPLVAPALRSRLDGVLELGGPDAFAHWAKLRSAVVADLKH